MNVIGCMEEMMKDEYKIKNIDWKTGGYVVLIK